MLMRIAAILLLTAVPASAFEFEALEGHVIDLDALDGPVLVVNTATRCGFTPQLDGLQTLHETYGPAGLTVLAVPSNDFGQEPGSADEVAEFCEVQYGLTLPMTTITHVRGPQAHPFFAWLADQGAEPGWNFNKALIDRDGALAGFWSAPVGPTSSAITGAIETALGD